MRLKHRALQRSFIATLMAGSLLVSFVPAMAQEQTWHDWSTMTLMDGEKYGIYPLSWYDDMQAKMDGQTLQTYCTEIGKKLEAISGVKLKETPDELAYSTKEVTRGEVLESIYKVLNQYTYPEDVNLGDDAITYMRENQIVMGTGKDLNLDKVCTLEEAATFGTRIINVFYKNLNAGSKGLLWKVEKDGNTIYMLGSIHLANYGAYPFSHKILDAYEASDVLGVELNFYDTEGIKYFSDMACYSDGSTLKEHIPADLYAQAIEASKKIGMSETDIAYCKPWYLGNVLTSTAVSKSTSLEEQQIAATLGIDNYFMTNALMTDKPIYELEGYKYQANLFDGFSQSLQEYYLNNGIQLVLDEETNKEGVELLDGWMEYWQKGDLEQFEKSFPKKETDPDATKEEQVALEEYNNKLLTVRDAEMTENIEKLLNSDEGKTYFIVVGSGHYVGEDGVINNLKKKGYTVTQIK